MVVVVVATKKTAEEKYLNSGRVNKKVVVASYMSIAIGI